MPYMLLMAVALALNAESLTESIVFDALIQSFALITATVVCFRFLDRRPIGRVVNLVWVRNFAFGMMLGAAAMSLIMLVEYLMGWIQVFRIGPTDEHSWSKLLGMLVNYWIVFTAVAFGEEALSRGYHLKNVSEGLRFLGPSNASLIAILATSSFFGLLHLSNPHTTIISTIGITLAGIMLAFGRVATGTLAAPIGIHLTWNFFQGPVFGFAVSGNDFSERLFTIEQRGPEIWTGGAFGPEAGLLGIIAIGWITVGLWWRSSMLQNSIPIETLKLARYRPRKTKRAQPKSDRIE